MPSKQDAAATWFSTIRHLSVYQSDCRCEQLELGIPFFRLVHSIPLNEFSLMHTFCVFVLHLPSSIEPNPNALQLHSIRFCFVEFSLIWLVSFCCWFNILYDFIPFMIVDATDEFKKLNGIQASADERVHTQKIIQFDCTVRRCTVIVYTSQNVWPLVRLYCLPKRISSVNAPVIPMIMYCEMSLKWCVYDLAIVLVWICK